MNTHKVDMGKITVTGVTPFNYYSTGIVEFDVEAYPHLIDLDTINNPPYHLENKAKAFNDELMTIINAGGDEQWTEFLIDYVNNNRDDMNVSVWDYDDFTDWYDGLHSEDQEQVDKAFTTHRAEVIKAVFGDGANHPHIVYALEEYISNNAKKVSVTKPGIWSKNAKDNYEIVTGIRRVSDTAMGEEGFLETVYGKCAIMKKMFSCSPYEVEYVIWRFYGNEQNCPSAAIGYKTLEEALQYCEDVAMGRPVVA